MTVFIHLINKKQRQHLDSLIGISHLLIQMSLDSPFDLCPFDNIFVHVSDSLSQCHLFGIAKLNMLIIRSTVYSRNGIALVKLTLSRKQKQLITGLYCNRLS